MKVYALLHLMLAIPLLFSLVVLPSTATEAATGSQPYAGFRKQITAANFAGSSLTGVVIGSRNARADIHLASSGLSTGHNRKLYGVDRSYWWGRLVSPQFSSAHLFNRAIASWNASTPAGTWVQVELRAYTPAENHWTKYYNLGIWASGAATIKRHSVEGQGNVDGTVATDTLVLAGAAVYSRYQYRLTLFTTDTRVTSRVRLVSVATSNSAKEPAGLNLASDRQAWGRDLDVPKRSQMIYPNGGEVWCSPTSTSMVLAYWGHGVTVPRAAAATYDYVYEGNGNWPFNTAWAGAYGLDAYVTRMSTMAQVEEWISAGVPVIISLGFNRGELDGAPIPSSNGHIIVVRGFTRSGNVIVNDPAAASDSAVRIIYKRAQLERLWLKHSGGTVYLVYPKGHAIPTSKSYGSW